MTANNSFRTSSHILGDVTLLGRLIQDRIGTLLDPHGLTHAQAVALVRLWRSPNGSMSQTKLISSLAVSRATGTQLLHDLESRDLVTREPDPGDARSNLVSLTPKGSALESDVLAIFDRVDGEIAGSLSSADWDRLAGSLTTMTERVRASKDLDG
jgi:DNA-binding MarR family transcriptional regulator